MHAQTHTHTHTDAYTYSHEYTHAIVNTPDCYTAGMRNAAAMALQDDDYAQVHNPHLYVFMCRYIVIMYVYTVFVRNASAIMVL